MYAPKISKESEDPSYWRRWYTTLPQCSLQ